MWLLAALVCCGVAQQSSVLKELKVRRSLGCLFLFVFVWCARWRDSYCPLNVSSSPCDMGISQALESVLNRFPPAAAVVEDDNSGSVVAVQTAMSNAPSLVGSDDSDDDGSNDQASTARADVLPSGSDATTTWVVLLTLAVFFGGATVTFAVTAIMLYR
jgi:hypothetical protein